MNWDTLTFTTYRISKQTFSETCQFSSTALVKSPRPSTHHRQISSSGLSTMYLLVHRDTKSTIPGRARSHATLFDAILSRIYVCICPRRRYCGQVPRVTAQCIGKRPRGEFDPPVTCARASSRIVLRDFWPHKGLGRNGFWLHLGHFGIRKGAMKV